MLGVLINFAAMIVGTLVGLVFKKGIPERLTEAIMASLGLCVLYVGITGTSEGENAVAIILAIVLGSAIGTAINIDRALERLGEFVKSKFKGGENTASVGKAMVTGTLICCVGGMAIVGSLEAGISGDNTILFTKSILDFIIVMMLAATLGFGVIFASIPLLIYEGALVLLSGLIQPFLTASVTNDLTCTGSILIMALGLNMLKITDIKVANLLPALLLSPLFTALFSMI